MISEKILTRIAQSHAVLATSFRQTFCKSCPPSQAVKKIARRLFDEQNFFATLEVEVILSKTRNYAWSVGEETGFAPIVTFSVLRQDVITGHDDKLTVADKKFRVIVR